VRALHGRDGHGVVEGAVWAGRVEGDRSRQAAADIYQPWFMSSCPVEDGRYGRGGRKERRGPGSGGTRSKGDSRGAPPCEVKHNVYGEGWPSEATGFGWQRRGPLLLGVQREQERGGRGAGD
jgi:hypothetical protein